MNNPYIAMTITIETFEFVTGSVGGPDERKGELEKVRVKQYIENIRQYCSIDDFEILLHVIILLYYHIIKLFYIIFYSIIALYYSIIRHIILHIKKCYFVIKCIKLEIYVL